MWALDEKVEMPTYEELKKIPIESTPREKEVVKDEEEKKEAAEKAFPFMIRRITILPTKVKRQINLFKGGD